MGSYFVFDGQSSEELGLKIKSKSVYGAGKPDVALTAIPGRNGEVVTNNKRIANCAVSYACFAPASGQAELATKMRNVRKWLFSGIGKYCWLSDSYEPGFLRKAVYNSKLDVTDQACRIGSFTVTFSCHPMRYLEEGLASATVPNGGSLFNPYPFASKPYLKITGSGSGTLSIQTEGVTRTWSFSSIDGYVECDSDLMNFYKGTALRNSIVTGSGYPELAPGENVLTYSGGITKVEVAPRWWCV